ncbi:hypothetical protein LCGC14_0894440 [marine sediment metagenome]|uniref:Radical SAM core domain-containing protein n=1 Tax=marine sediment metagenome TaxID=412755 RepID=A0A0F9P350_9ZZZZ
MNRTKIQWCQNPNGTQGYTWNPITGCLNGCGYCWARGLANGRLKNRMLGNPRLAGYDADNMTADQKQILLDPFYPRFWESRLGDRSLFQAKPRGIFAVSMGDLFGKGVPTEWTDRVMDQIRIHRQHRFYLLTKQPQNLPRSSSYFPDNAWVGASVTSVPDLIYATKHLHFIEAPVKYISYEPMLEYDGTPRLTEGLLRHAGVSWIILGAQTKPTVQPDIEWVRQIVAAADAAGIPVFLKDSLRPLRDKTGILLTKDSEGYNTLRQEMPK